MANNTVITNNHPEIIENMVDGLFTVDTNRVITSWNKAAEDILGFKNEEVLGKKCDFFNSPTCMGSIINNNGLCPLFSEKRIAMEVGLETAKTIFIPVFDIFFIPAFKFYVFRYDFSEFYGFHRELFCFLTI